MQVGRQSSVVSRQSSVVNSSASNVPDPRVMKATGHQHIRILFALLYVIHWRVLSHVRVKHGVLGVSPFFRLDGRQWNRKVLNKVWQRDVVTVRPSNIRGQVDAIRLVDDLTCIVLSTSTKGTPRMAVPK